MCGTRQYYPQRKFPASLMHERRYFLMLYSISVYNHRRIHISFTLTFMQGARLVLNLRINAVLEEHTSTQDMISIVNTDFDSAPGTLQGARNPDIELNFL